MSDVGLSCDLGRGVMETLSVSAVSTARGTDGRSAGAVPPMRSARVKGQKFGARPRGATPMGRKRSVSPTARPAQNRCITQTLHLSGPPGIIPIGINHTIICQPIGLYLSYGYRNIITCTGRNSPWAGVFRVQLSRRGDRVGHQLTFLPHHADVVNGAYCTMYNK